jgi:hypothetical protein
LHFSSPIFLLTQHLADQPFYLFPIQESGDDPVLLFYDQNGTGSQLNNPVGATSEHSFIQRRMAGCANYQEIGAEFAREIDDASHGMTDQHMGHQRYTLVGGHRFRPLQHLFVSMIRILALGFDLSYQFRERRNLFHRSHVQFRLVLPGKLERKFKRLERRAGAIILVDVFLDPIIQGLARSATAMDSDKTRRDDRLAQRGHVKSFCGMGLKFSEP